MLFHYADLHALSLCRLFLTTTIFLLSWSVASSSTMPLLLTIILSCLHALSLCRPACSFTMQAFNHNNFFIVMERGKFFYYATFVDNYFVMSCMLFFHYADHNNVMLASFTMPLLLTIILVCMLFHYADLHALSLCRLLTTTIFYCHGAWQVLLLCHFC